MAADLRLWLIFRPLCFNLCRHLVFVVVGGGVVFTWPFFRFHGWPFRQPEYLARLH